MVGFFCDVFVLLGCSELFVDCEAALVGAMGLDEIFTFSNGHRG
jgi:hypothetical protein